MKNSIKRIVCVLFSLFVLVGAMSACGSKKDTTSDTSGASSNKGGSSGASTVSILTPSDATGEYKNFDPYASIPDSIKGSTVRFATWIDHTRTEGAVPLANFERDTGLKVELFTVAQSGYVSKLQSSIASGDIPDVFVSNEGDQNFPLTMQFAAPINKVSTVDLKEPIWDQSMIATATIDGNVYLVNTIGSPWSGSNLCYYNKSLFEENGFTTPAEYYEQGNWTWATMKKVMKDVKSLGDDYAGGMVDVEILGDSAGVSFVMYDYKTATFKSGVNTKELLAAYQWYADAREEGLLGGTYQKFKEGKCGIVTTGVYGLKATGHFKDMDPNDIGFTFLPSLEDGTASKTSSIYRMYGIIAGCKNANAAGYFIRYWLDPKNYDIDNTFVTIEAGNFYYTLINKTADEKYFNYDDAVCILIGSDSSGVFINGPMGASSAQVKTKLDEVSNKVDQAVTEANKIITDLKNANK